MIYKGAKIYTEDYMIENGYIKTEGRKVVEIGLGEIEGGIDLDGKIIIPGFINQHIHGFNGVDTMDATKEVIDVFAKSITKYGTTAFLPTTMTQSCEKINLALKNVCDYMKKENTSGKAQVIGINLEGPFISKVYKGAQLEKYIVNPNIEIMKSFEEISENNIKLVTYAPEVQNGDFTKYLKEKNIVGSVGHSNATFEEVEKAVKDGLSNITHFHNAQSPHHHRTPGVVTAGFCFDELKVELIVDGIHVNKDSVRTIFKIKGANGIIGISDSMRAGGLEDGEYTLGGQKVIKSNGTARLENGVLAGSVTNMHTVFKNLIKFTGCSLEEAILMTSSNSANQLGVYNEKGSIKVGKDADFVILDDELNVFMTICCGEIAFKRGE